MWSWYTADDKRSAAAIIAVITAMIITAEMITIVVGGIAAMLLTGGGLATPSLGRWPHLVAGVLGDPADPAAVFGGTFPAWLYWSLTLLLGLAASAVGLWLGRVFYRATAPTGTGFASRADVGRELSTAVCRRRAAVTRPDLTRRQLRHGSPSQVGIPLHQAAVSRSDLWLPLENATGVIAPQQSGKSLMDLIHKIIAAPGGLLVTSTKLDLYLHTARARARAGSPVQVLDLTGATTWPDRVRWNPIADCLSVKTAKRRAQALLRATAGDTADGTGNHAFFERRAVDVMTAYLLAAAHSGATVAEFVGWCQDDTDTQAATILHGRPEFAAVRQTLQQAQAVVEETRSGIWETLRDAITCLTDPDVVTSALPDPEQPGLNIDQFLAEHGTIYVIGSEQDAATQAPLITAFVQEVLDTARRRALAHSQIDGRERLTPPFTAVLDEIASICPLPDLPNTLSDSAGRGVLVHYALQSPAQAQLRWGKAATTLFDNTTALTVFGGLKSEDTLKWASLLAGRRLEERRSRQAGRSLTDPGSVHIGTERVDILEPAAVRQIPRGRALLIMRTLPPLIVQLRPAWTRPDWATLHADATTLRRGEHPAQPPAMVAPQPVGSLR